ncbi:hypothetical protein BH23CHL2_BH23CHL2_31270 [soil metagenome]
MSTNVTRLNPELAALLKRAASEGQSLRVEIDDQPYDLSIAPAAEERRTDIWANYDPARLRAVLRRNAELPERADLAEVESIITDIRAQRGQDSQGRPAST